MHARTLTVILAISAASCGSGSPVHVSDAEPGPPVRSLHCDRGWDDCYLKARRLCGDAGFEELDRYAGQDVVADGRFEQMDSSGRIYRGEAHVMETDRVLTIRCR